MRPQSGQTATEYLLIISVVTIALVSAAYAFLPRFRAGVSDLAVDVSEMLATGSHGVIGTARDGTGGPSPASVPQPGSGTGGLGGGGMMGGGAA